MAVLSLKGEGHLRLDLTGADVSCKCLQGKICAQLLLYKPSSQETKDSKGHLPTARTFCSLERTSSKRHSPASLEAA